MKVRLIVKDVRRLEADWLLVKHFTGVTGGAEKDINTALGGALASELESLDVSPVGKVAIHRLTNRDLSIGAVALIHFGRLKDFSLERLAEGLRGAVEAAKGSKLGTLAIPIIGISGGVGLPLDAAFKTTIFTLANAFANERSFNCEELLIYDDSPEKISRMLVLLPATLSQLGIEWNRVSANALDIKPRVGPRHAAESVQISAVLSEDEIHQSDTVLAAKRARPMVFISHAHQDKFYARQIEKRLSTLLRVFLDENDIEVGSRLEDTLRESIESCDSFLVILSNNSQNSDWVKYEIGAAWAFKKQIVQVRLDSVPQPSVAAGVLFIDARDQFEALDKIEEHYKKLRE